LGGVVEYVMVPVPEELEARVKEFVIQRNASSLHSGWSQESIATFYGQLDEPSRTTIKAIARGVVDDEPVTIAKLAEVVGVTTREVLGITLELVHRLRALGGAAFPLFLLDAPEGADGDERPAVMPRDGAHMVLATGTHE
jgi:transcriptional regulator with XRE-family HTH domain